MTFSVIPENSKMVIGEASTFMPNLTKEITLGFETSLTALDNVLNFNYNNVACPLSFALAHMNCCPYGRRYIYSPIPKYSNEVWSQGKGTRPFKMVHFCRHTESDGFLNALG